MYEPRIENIRFPLKIVHLAKGICNSISFADNFLCLCLSEADSLDSLIVNALKVAFIYILDSSNSSSFTFELVSSLLVQFATTYKGSLNSNSNDQLSCQFALPQKK